jgi:hypothetical protein
MEPLKGAKLLIAKAKDDEILLEKIITNTSNLRVISMNIKILDRI